MTSVPEDQFQLFSSLRYDAELLRAKDRLGNDAAWNSRKASPFYMLDYHRDRMLRAATHWGWIKAAETIRGTGGLTKLESFLTAKLEPSSITPLRLKVTLSEEGALELEFSKVPSTALANLFPSRLPDPSEELGDEGLLGAIQLQPEYEVYVDAKITQRSEYTHYKTTKREMYDSARMRAQINPTDAKEILTVNESDGSIMEGSTTTPYFWRRGRWVTPPVSTHFSSDIGSGGQDGTTRRWALESGLAVEQVVLADTLLDREGIWLSNGVRGFNFGRIRLGP